jgi:hypothetical protein
MLDRFKLLLRTAVSYALGISMSTAEPATGSNCICFRRKHLLAAHQVWLLPLRSLHPQVPLRVFPPSKPRQLVGLLQVAPLPQLARLRQFNLSQ